MFDVIGRIVAFFVLLVIGIVCAIAGAVCWAAGHVPPNLTTPEDITHFKYASIDHLFIAYYPFAIAGVILLSAVIAFKPRPWTFAIAGPVAALYFFMAPFNVRDILARQHALHPGYYSGASTPIPAPGAPSIPLPAPGLPDLAPPGVFYLLTAAHAETKDGIIGVPPGTRVQLLQPGLYLTPAGKMHLDETQLTNDLGRARMALAYDRNAQAASHATVVVVNTVTFNGIRKVPVLINGVLTRNFIVDSGATNIAIPTAMIAELTKSGTLREYDYLPGYATMMIADGTKMKRRRFLLHSIKVGETTVTDVLATDSGPNGALLLGMSFLSKAKAVYDTEKGQLLFSR